MKLRGIKAFPGMEDSILPWMGKTMKELDLFVSAALSQQGVNLTRKQMICMKILEEHGPLPQSELAFLTDRDKTSLTRLINSMEKKNVVARIPSETDKRVNLVHLTTSGRKLLAKTAPIMVKMVKKLESSITKEDREAFKRVLKQIHQNIESQSK
ncbi:MAG: MarR family transcriptional regulator [Flavobacteriales bacterium]|nr:MarR family transcriptional regulator [Flavobacteriales bacterium]